MLKKLTVGIATTFACLSIFTQPTKAFDSIENDEWMLLPGYGFNMHETDFKKKERSVIASIKNGARIHKITIPTSDKTIISNVKDFCKLRKRSGGHNLVWKNIIERYSKFYKNISNNKKERILISHEAFKYFVLVENVSYKVYCPKYINDLNKNTGLNKKFWKMVRKLETQIESNRLPKI